MKINKVTIYVLMFLFFPGLVYSRSSLFFYSDYQDIMMGKVKPNINLFKRTDVDKKRLINIIQMLESKSKKPDDLLMFIDSMIAQPRFLDSSSLLERSKVNVLMSSGRYQVALEYMNSHPSTKFSKNLSVIALIEMNRIDEAVNAFNNIPPSYYNKRTTAPLLSLGRTLILDFDVLRTRLLLSKVNQITLSHQLIDFYTKNKFYSLIYTEYMFLSRYAKTVEELRINLVSMCEFAHENKMTNLEIDAMTRYLKTFNKNKFILENDVSRVNNYTNTVVLYRVDERNENRSKKHLPPSLLLAQSQAARIDHNTEKMYLKNRLLVSSYNNNKDDSYFLDVVKLAKLTKNKLLIIANFDNKKQSSKIQLLLLDAYLSIKPPSDKNGNTISQNANDAYMAKAYLPFIIKCDATKAPIVNLFKGNEFVKNKQINKAYLCFSLSNLDDVSLSEKSKSVFEKEILQVNYLHLKNSHKPMLAFDLAMRTGKAEMIADATRYLLNAERTIIPIARVDDALASGKLSNEQYDAINNLLLVKLRKTADTKALKKRLLASPLNHAFELAWLYLDNDEHKKVFTYLMRGLEQNEKSDEYTKIKIFRYLDSQYLTLSIQEIQRVKGLTSRYPSINKMLMLHQIEGVMKNDFNTINSGNIINQVTTYLTIYKERMNSLRGNVEKANYTAQYALQIKTMKKFTEALITLSMKTKREDIRYLLEKQIQQVKQKELLLYKTLMSMKIEGVYDRRILDSIKLQLKAH